MEVMDIKFDDVSFCDLPMCSSIEEGIGSKEDVFLPIPDDREINGDARRIFCDHARIRADSRMGAARAMLPFYWLQEPWKGVGVGLSFLRNATVFGGRISGRSAVAHRHGQCLIRACGALVEDSFGVLDGARTYAEDVLRPVSENRYAYVGPKNAEYLSGTYFLLGNAHHHFGHFMLEGLSRLWAFKSIVSRVPSIRLVIYEPEVPSFIIELLALAGIKREQIIFASKAVVLERLVVPRMAMRTHTWITSFQATAWGMIPPQASAGGAKRVFLSRKNVRNRRLVNEDEVERMFERSGFVPVSSEGLPIRDQLELVGSADCIAGAVGSQMYLAAFMRPGSKVLVVAPENFYLKDDFLVSAVSGLSLKVQLGEAVDFSKPKNERCWNIQPQAVSRLIEESEVC